MNFEYQDEIDNEYIPEPVISSVEYVALIGITNNRLGIRLRPGDDVPAELIADTDSLNWLLDVKRAIKIKDTGG